MFERFTDRARRAVVLAQEESRALNHDYIGTEHLLLGLVHEGLGIAAQTLLDVGLTLDVVRDEVKQRIGMGTETPRGHIPFTPRAKKVLELSLREALQLNHKHIGTEHILLGLVREGQGVAALIMLSGADGGLERVEAGVMARLGTSGMLDPDELGRIQAAAASRIAQRVATGADDEVVKRLEAIEARLSAIERMLREERGEATG